jgi:hypothetical protein
VTAIRLILKAGVWVKNEPFVFFALAGVLGAFLIFATVKDPGAGDRSGDWCVFGQLFLCRTDPVEFLLLADGELFFRLNQL